MIITGKLTAADRLVVEGLSEDGIVFMEADDESLLRRLEEVVRSNDFPTGEGERMECWLIPGEAETLRMLQTEGLPEEIGSKVDVFATTMEDLVAKTVFVRLPGAGMTFPTLDRRRISMDDDSTVHLVVAGFSAQAEAVMMNAALVAHYPNYCRDSSLRTRITVIDDGMKEKAEEFIRRYGPLFENSYYRILSNVEPECVVHHPMYEGRRKDFVDVEWEFIEGSICGGEGRRRLREWSLSDRRQLTVAVCNDDFGRNMAEAVSLPSEVYVHGATVLCHTEGPAVLPHSTETECVRNVMPFGSWICTLDTLRMLKKLAMRINYVYDHAFSISAGEPVAAPSSIDDGRMKELWNGLTALPKVYSNFFHAMTLGTKMHSLGHAPGDCNALTEEEIEVMTEVEHNRWSIVNLILGYRPATDEEQEMMEGGMKELRRRLREAGVHYDLRAYDDLCNDGTGKDVRVYDRVLIESIPLIMNN